jgi:hypothetical protein
MINYIEILKLLNKSRWWLILLLFLAFIINIFSVEIKRILDIKLFNEDVVVNSLDNDILIENALYELMKDCKSDRAYIFRFHNGVTYYNGSHKSKMSCDYEVVGKGISSEAQRLQDIPTGLYANWIKKVIQYKMFFIEIEDIEDLRTRNSLEAQGINGMAVLPYYRDGKVLALIGVDYVRPMGEEDKEKYNENQLMKINFFKKRANLIGDLLI